MNSSASFNYYQPHAYERPVGFYNELTGKPTINVSEYVKRLKRLLQARMHWHFTPTLNPPQFRPTPEYYARSTIELDQKQKHTSKPLTHAKPSGGQPGAKGSKGSGAASKIATMFRAAMLAFTPRPPASSGKHHTDDDDEASIGLMRYYQCDRPSSNLASSEDYRKTPAGRLTYA